MRDFSANKNILEQRLAELDSRTHKIEDQLDNPVSKDFEEQATEREDSEMLESLGSAALTEMGLIRVALERIADGSYGICASCGDDISDERLAAVPHAALCRNCAQRKKA